MPNVSVIVPTFNSGSYVKETLQSILAQSYQDIEIVVVDDASTDDTAEVVKSLKSDKINYISLPENHGGPSKARNVGIKNARGKYIAIFDSDDLMLPGRIDSVVSKMDEYPEIGLVCTDAIKFDDMSGDYAYNHLNPQHYSRFNSLKTRCIDSGFYIIDKKQAYDCLFYENFVETSSVTVRKEVFEEIGYFDESFTNADDWDMWFRISHRYDFGYLDAVCVRYRIREGSITTRDAKLGNNRIRVLRNRLEMQLEDNTRNQAHKLISVFYANMGYSLRCANQMQLSRMNYMMSLKEYPTWTVFVHWLITFLPFDAINTLKNINIVKKIKSMVTFQREIA